MTRDQLIEEIVGEFKDRFIEHRSDYRPHFVEYKCPDTTPAEDALDFLRSSLLKISDASMNAVEVEKHGYGDSPKGESWNSAITASQEKRRLFTK